MGSASGVEVVSQDCDYGNGQRAMRIATREIDLHIALVAAKRLPEHREKYLVQAATAAKDLVAAIESQA